MSLPSQKLEEPPTSDASTEVGVKDESHAEAGSNGNSTGKEDIERGVADTETYVHPRKDLPTWKWISTMVSLGLGAMLYGMTCL